MGREQRAEHFSVVRIELDRRSRRSDRRRNRREWRRLGDRRRGGEWWFSDLEMDWFDVDPW
jgi:hypothetical protein